MTPANGGEPCHVCLEKFELIDETRTTGAIEAVDRA